MALFVAIETLFLIRYFRKLSINQNFTDTIVEEIRAEIESTKLHIDNTISGLFGEEELDEKEMKKQEEEQAEQFIQTVTVAMISAFQTQEMQETLRSIIAPVVPESILSSEELEKVEKMSGNAIVNMLSDANPIIPLVAKSVLGEDWQQQVAANPKMYVMLMQKIQASGALDMFSSFMGTTGSTSQSRPTASKSYSGW